MSANAQNEFRQFAWNVAASIAKTSIKKSGVSHTKLTKRATPTKRVQAK